MKKTTKKTFKPAYTVDMTNAKTAEDLFLEIVIGKVNAGVAITGDELKQFVEHFVNIAADNAVKATANALTIAIALSENFEEKPKKYPWYKRFWRWVTRKNK